MRWRGCLAAQFAEGAGGTESGTESGAAEGLAAADDDSNCDGVAAVADDSNGGAGDSNGDAAPGPRRSDSTGFGNKRNCDGREHWRYHLTPGMAVPSPLRPG